MKRNSYYLISALLTCGMLSCNKDEKPEKGQEFADFTTNWTRCWGTTLEDDFCGSVLDNSGNLYMVGASQPDGYQGDIFVNKISLASPSLSWSKKFDSGDQDLCWSPSGNGHANGGGGSRCIALDADGNAYIAGSSKNGFYEVFVLKIDPSGNVLWETHWEANSSGLANGEAKAYALDVSGDKVFVTGSCASASVFLLALDQATGSVQSGTNVGIDASAGYNDIGYTIKSVNGDVVYIAGWEGQNNSGILYKFSSGGSVFEWQERVDVGYTNRFTDIDLDESGNIYLAVDFRGVSTYLGVIKLDASGNFIWGKKFQGESNDRNNISSIRVINGSLYVGGRGSFAHYDVGQFGDATYLRLDLSGNLKAAYNYYSKDFNTGERIEGIHFYNGSLIIAGETWPEENGIEGRWCIPTIHEESFTAVLNKVTSTSIDTGDGVVSATSMSVSDLGGSLYEASEGTRGSCDIMIHSISE